MRPAADWRYVGIKNDGPRLAAQNAVPTLQQVLQNVLDGRPTGLGNSVFDEDYDDDLSMMDKLDVEAERQALSIKQVTKPAKAESQPAPLEQPTADDKSSENSV